MKPSHSISLRLSQAQRGAVLAAAERAGCTPSQLARAALAQAVQAQGLSWPDDLSEPGERLAAMAAGTPFIDVANMQARVARWRGVGGGGWRTIHAANWHELEDAAAAAVEQAGGALSLSGQYACPPEIAKLARWD